MQLKAKEKQNKFKFKCTKCGKCCDQTIIHLYPFDIKLICDNLGISVDGFHQKYSMFKLDENNIYRCALRNKPKCPFKKEDNTCGIYNFRPIRCRLFPVGRFYDDEKILYLLSNFPSPGFDSNKKQSFEQWVNDQGVSLYDKLATDWNRFLINLKEIELGLDDQQRFKEIFYGFEKHNSNNDQDLDEFMGKLYVEWANHSKNSS
jgi:uncharacterized protein